MCVFCLGAVVPLKHGLNYEILEKGHVRFWLQAVKLSPSVSYRFIVNDKEVTSGEVTSTIMMCFVSLFLPWSLIKVVAGLKSHLNLLLVVFIIKLTNGQTLMI